MAKGFKIPKKIAGVKVPRHLRKSGRSLGALLETPLGREIAASALTAMAGVLLSRKQTRETVGEAGHAVGQAGSSAVGAVGSVAHRVADAAIGAASEVLRNRSAAEDAGKDAQRAAKRRSEDHPRAH